MTETLSASSLILYIKERFHNTSDLFVEEIEWEGQPAIVCYYTVLTEGGTLNEQLEILRKRAKEGIPDWGESGAINCPSIFDVDIDRCSLLLVQSAVIFPKTNKLLKITIPNITVRSPDEPTNEFVIRGSHEGFVESIDKNISLIRKHLTMPDLVVKEIRLGSETNTRVHVCLYRNNC